MSETDSLGPSPKRSKEYNMPTSFIVEYRNPGHWDIYVKRQRVYTIRGTPDKSILRDERAGEPVPLPFRNIAEVMAYVNSVLMM